MKILGQKQQQHKMTSSSIKGMKDANI